MNDVSYFSPVAEPEKMAAVNGSVNNGLRYGWAKSWDFDWAWVRF